MVEHTVHSIGIIKTPYHDSAPYQPVDSDDREFYIVLNREYSDGLYKLDTFNYVYLIYYVHQVNSDIAMRVLPPWADGREIGVFASRSPVRPNFLGLSVVRIKNIKENIIYTSGLDVFDETPLLDIKPYIQDLDVKDDANYGWVDETEDSEHLALHIQGIPHDY